MKKDRAELLEVINKNIHHISNHENWVKEIKEELSKYRISEGRVEKVLSNPEVLNNDLRELALFTEQFYVKTGLQELNIDDWFTKSEMKESRQFDFILENNLEDIEFPLEIKNVNIVGNGVFVGSLDVKTVAKLMKSQLLNYNFEIQRQATQIKRQDHFILTPTINKKNVKEMKNLLLKGELIHTTLAFNAATQTSDSGEELVYNSKTNSLTITEGTRLDILDGFHRCLASRQAFESNPELDFRFIVIFSNYTTKQAQQYQAQLAKATPIPKARVQELEANRLSDTVVQMLKSESELKGRVSSSKGKMNITAGDLVSYSVLSEAIDREFNMKVKLDTYEVAEYLIKYFEYLFGYYPEEFTTNTINNDSLMTYNKMFAGYISLAAQMQKEKVELKELKSILDKIDFDRNNKLWLELGITNSEGKIVGKTDEKKISKYFKELL